MSEGLPKRLSQRDVLQLRQEAVAHAEAAFKGSEGRRARHYARLQLARNRQALLAQEKVMDA